MRRGVDVGDGIAVEDHADELGGPATLEDALVAIVVATFAGVDHEAHTLHGGLRGDLGAPGAGAARLAGVMRLMVPSSSSWPQRPQLDRVRMYSRTCDSVGGVATRRATRARRSRS